MKALMSILPGRQSLQIKYVISYIAIIVAVLVLMNTYPLATSQDMVFKSKQAALQSQAAVMSTTLAGLEKLTAEGVSQVVSLLDDMDLSRIIITDYDGRILYDSEDDGQNMGRYALLQEITLALQGWDVFRSGYRDGAFHSRAAAPVVYRNMTIGAVYVYERDSEQADLLVGLQRNLRSISAVICVAVLVVSALLSRIMTGRLSKLLSAIRSLREGQYSHRVQMSGKDELADLAAEFNLLTERLQTTDEVRRRFVSDASHELKTPLASIRLLSDSILQNESMDEAVVREFVGDIGEEADRLTRITEKLLALTRLDSQVERERLIVDLRDTVEKVFHMLAPLAQSTGVTLRSELSGRCPVLATADDLYQIMFNLVENAIKYNVKGGSVLVRLWKDGGKVFLRVEDTGIGIPEEEQAKVFDRFYRVDKARSREAGGTGLGLSIVRDTVRQHGGFIALGSRKEGGTWFQVEFPEAGKEAEL